MLLKGKSIHNKHVKTYQQAKHFSQTGNPLQLFDFFHKALFFILASTASIRSVLKPAQ